MNAAEHEALQGLPWIAQLVYMRVLRRHMDYETGLVGIRGKPRAISRQTIIEALYVETRRGPGQSGAPTERQIIRALDWLKKAGLIVRIPSQEHLIFSLPKATTGGSVQNKPVRNRSGQNGRNRSGFGHSETKEKTRRYEKTNSKTGHPLKSQKTAKPVRPISFSSRRNNNPPHTPPAAPEAELPTKITIELVRSVFDDWRRITNNPEARMDSARYELIVSVLSVGYTQAELIDAFVGATRSSFHVGYNPQGIQYLDIGLILRSTEAIERFRRYRIAPPKPRLDPVECGYEMITQAEQYWQQMRKKAMKERSWSADDADR